jgi:hypothetical protein
MRTPKNVSRLWLECRCCDIKLDRWEAYMAGAKRADKRRLNALVHEHLPWLWEELSLNLWNPYHYWKTAKHLILVHSGIEYFLRYEP